MSESPNDAAVTSDFEFAALGEARNYRNALVKEFSPYLQGRVIEIGAGIGQISALLLELPGVKELISVEPNPAFCRLFRAKLPKAVLIEGTIEKLLPGSECQAAVSINVLEHIREDERELAAYQKLLCPNRGCLCLFVPARPQIYAPIDADFGHYRRYTRPELSQKLKRAGFQVVRLNYFNCVGYLAWWLNFRVLKKRHFDVSAVRWFDRVVFPIVHRLESNIAYPPIGQSLLAVARA